MMTLAAFADAERSDPIIERSFELVFPTSFFRQGWFVVEPDVPIGLGGADAKFPKPDGDIGLHRFFAALRMTEGDLHRQASIVPAARPSVERPQRSSG